MIKRSIFISLHKLGRACVLLFVKQLRIYTPLIYFICVYPLALIIMLTVYKGIKNVLTHFYFKKSLWNRFIDDEWIHRERVKGNPK